MIIIQKTPRTQPQRIVTKIKQICGHYHRVCYFIVAEKKFLPLHIYNNNDTKVRDNDGNNFTN